MQNLINTLRSHLQRKTGMVGPALDNLLSRTLISLERQAFARVLTELLTEEERYIYKELLDMDGQVDGYGFLEGIRPGSAESIVMHFMKQEVDRFMAKT